MNTETLSNHCRPKKDYQQLHKSLKGRCEEISKDNDALSSRLINLKLLIFKAENQCRKLQDRLQYHGVDYHAAAAAASSYPDVTDFASEKTESTVKTRPKHIRKKKNNKLTEQHQTTPSDTVYPLSNKVTSNPDFDANLSTSFPIKDNLI